MLNISYTKERAIVNTYPKQRNEHTSETKERNHTRFQQSKLIILNTHLRQGINDTTHTLKNAKLHIEVTLFLLP
jgi:hypothetical protein